MDLASSGGAHCLEQSAKENTQPAFHLTFSWELTQHITVQLIKWTRFRSDALTPIFQGAMIRSTVTEECLPNKNWCITSWKAGWRWAFCCLHTADPDLYFTQFNMLHLICVFAPFCQTEWRLPLVTSSILLICIPHVFVIMLPWKNLLFLTCTFVFLYATALFFFNFSSFFVACERKQHCTSLTVFSVHMSSFAN